MEKTHWKAVVSDPNYIGEADFAPGEEKVATIRLAVCTKEQEPDISALYLPDGDLAAKLAEVEDAAPR